MAITIRKQQTVKTIRVAAPPSSGKIEAPAPSAEAPQAAAVEVQRAAVVASSGRSPYTWAVIVCLLAVLTVITLLGLQAWELNFYYQPEPVFLRAQGTAVTPGSPTP